MDQIEHAAAPPPRAPTPESVDRPARARQRLRGIDAARALAIVGMVMVHIGPVRDDGTEVTDALYRSAHGRASILFVVLAGIGVSLLAGDRSPDRLSSTYARLAWRAVVLLPAGLALQTLDINVAVILQYYAVYFVVAAAVLRLSDRALWIVAGCSATIGPLLLVWLERTSPHLFEPGVPDWYDIARIARDVMLTGYYPVVVWTAPLVVGIWVGNRDLRSTAAVTRLAVAGTLLAAAGFATSDLLVASAGPAFDAADWRSLYTIEPHNEMPLWVLTSTGIAVAVIGVCVLLARRLPRVAWPLTALGQLAFTAYVLHLLVLEVWPDWLLRTTYDGAWVSVIRFTVVAVVLAVAYRAVASRGPFELLLRPRVLRARSSTDVSSESAGSEQR